MRETEERRKEKEMEEKAMESKSERKLKVIRGGKRSELKKRKSAALTVGEAIVSPPQDMPAGEYRVICEKAYVANYAPNTCVLHFRVAEGAFFGVTLRYWIDMEFLNGGLREGCAYVKHCELALGYEPEPEQDLSPDIVFPGKMFLVRARYRGTVSSWEATRADSTVCKDEWDFLRVGKLIALEGSTQ
jgi:hypothetical protein